MSYCFAIREGGNLSFRYQVWSDTREPAGSEVILDWEGVSGKSNLAFESIACGILQGGLACSK